MTAIVAGLDYSTAEEWRQITDHPNYEVSNKGNVRRATDGVNTYAGRHLKHHERADGRFQVVISLGNRRSRSVCIHVLVAQAFLDPRPAPNMEINHIDGDHQNNVATNLEWLTGLENMRHGFALGLFDNRPVSGAAKINAPKTHCPQGHPYNDANTHLYDGRRYCRACHYEHSRAYSLKKRGVAA